MKTGPGIVAFRAFAAMLTALVGSVVLLIARQSWSGYAAAARQPLWLWSGSL